MKGYCEDCNDTFELNIRTCYATTDETVELTCPNCGKEEEI